LSSQESGTILGLFRVLGLRLGEQNGEIHRNLSSRYSPLLQNQENLIFSMSFHVINLLIISVALLSPFWQENQEF